MIDTLLIDCDGVLTDGKVNISQDGKKLFKSFNSLDIAPTRELIARGIRVIIVTADDSGFAKEWAKKVGAELIVLRNKADIDTSDFGIFAACGNDVWDLPMLNKAHKIFCPADAHANVKSMWSIIVLKLKGGEGVMTEIFKYVI
jgi:3-deoxy-D-manno-octulosonate 8-phosphate phosphatase KdsC-like HAD superfamily phosphatase